MPNRHGLIILDFQWLVQVNVPPLVLFLVWRSIRAVIIGALVNDCQDWLTDSVRWKQHAIPVRTGLSMSWINLNLCKNLVASKNDNLSFHITSCHPLIPNIWNGFHVAHCREGWHIDHLLVVTHLVIEKVLSSSQSLSPFFLATTRIGRHSWIQLRHGLIGVVPRELRTHIIAVSHILDLSSISVKHHVHLLLKLIGSIRQSASCLIGHEPVNSVSEARLEFNNRRRLKWPANFGRRWIEWADHHVIGATVN